MKSYLKFEIILNMSSVNRSHFVSASMCLDLYEMYILSKTEQIDHIRMNP